MNFIVLKLSPWLLAKQKSHGKKREMIQVFNAPMAPGKFPHLKYLDIYLFGGGNFRGYDFFSLVYFLEASPDLECFNLCVSMVTYSSH